MHTCGNWRSVIIKRVLFLLSYFEFNEMEALLNEWIIFCLVYLFVRDKYVLGVDVYIYLKIYISRRSFQLKNDCLE